MRALEIRIAETGRNMMNEDDEDRGCRRATPRMFLAQTPCSRGAESIAFHRHDRPAGFHDVFHLSQAPATRTNGWGLSFCDCGPDNAGRFDQQSRALAQRAEEMRLLAGQIKGEISKQAMLRIAADYDRLSQRAEQRAHGFRPAWSGETFGLSNEPRSVRPVAGRAGGGAGDAMSDVA
jgi:hypothetical protein